jgi:hypothetical protein
LGTKRQGISEVGGKIGFTLNRQVHRHDIEEVKKVQ